MHYSGTAAAAPFTERGTTPRGGGYTRVVAVIDAPSPKLRRGWSRRVGPRGGRSTFRRHAAHDRRAKDEQHCIDHDPIRNHVAFLLWTNMAGRVGAGRQARCDGRHTTVGFPLPRNPSIGARFRSNMLWFSMARQRICRRLATRISRGAARPLPVPSSRCQTARFAASTAQHLSFPRRISACGSLPSLVSLSLRLSPHLRRLD